MYLSSVRIKICDIGNTGTLVDAEIFEGDGAFIEGVNAGDKLAVESIAESGVASTLPGWWSLHQRANTKPKDLYHRVRVTYIHTISACRSPLRSAFGLRVESALIGQSSNFKIKTNAARFQTLLLYLTCLHLNTRKPLHIGDTTAASQPQRVMRNTRGRVATTATPTKETRISQDKPVTSIEHARVLQRHPPARRNAPPRAQGRESSISTNPARPDDETEFIEDDDEYPQPDGPGSQPREIASGLNPYSPTSQYTPGRSSIEQTPAIYGQNPYEPAYPGAGSANQGDSYMPSVPQPESNDAGLGGAGLASDSPGTSPELDSEKLKNLKMLETMVPDLARAADSLYKYSNQEPSDNDVFQGCLRMKRHAFDSMQNIFIKLGQPYKGDFVDFASFLELGSTQQQKSLFVQIARVNTVIAYDRIRHVEDGQAPEIFTFFKTFNEVFPNYFILDPRMFQEPEVILDMRTWLLVETLSRTDGQGDIDKLLVEVFCDPYKLENFDSIEEWSDYPALLSGQYFRGVGDNGHVDTGELCSERIMEIAEVFKQSGKHKTIAHLSEKYPLQELLNNLRSCFDAMYNILADEESVRVGTQSPYLDQQAAFESQGDPFGSDSQSIVRAETQEAEPSLFVNKRSLLALERDTQGGDTLPPSNQQPTGPKPQVPRDYHQHANADLLRSPFPPASSFRLVSGSDKGQHRGYKRPRSFTTEGDDEDDPFETDDRCINPVRREELKRQMPPPPRPETISRSLTRRVPVPSSARSVPPAFEQESFRDSTPQAASRPPSSSVVNYDALKKAASQRNREARLADPDRQGTRQRVPWSDHDTQLLLDLIQEHGARWSMIESECKNYFEHPRNQQAYRDRARNLKTEVLITDAVLPPNFNEVALGSKEIARVKAVGKNPHRREEDVETNGNPINTELLESTLF
ncbi:hypothetical protein FSST1_009215 [Fusarium sambucinum]